MFITLDPTEYVNTVPCPDKDYWSEFEIQATLFCKLRELKVDVRGEVKWRAKDRSVCRFDLVIYVNGNATEIIEVKAAPVKHKSQFETTRQPTRYRRFGVPVTFVYGIEGANKFLRRFGDV